MANQPKSLKSQISALKLHLKCSEVEKQLVAELNRSLYSDIPEKESAQLKGGSFFVLQRLQDEFASERRSNEGLSSSSTYFQYEING